MKLLAGLVVAFVLVLSNLGHAGGDGPFPIYASVGIWPTSNKEYRIQINIWKFVEDDKVIMRVALLDSEGKSVAKGYTLHNGKNSTLHVILTSPKGEKMQVTIVPEYKVDTLSNKKSLEIKFDMIQLDSPHGAIVPNTSTISE